ncbi:4Fe-4S binding protein [Herbaspirillum sp. HC18]|nr:4Fe-4S binding protein [Herbaspirillum sp. HC18]
MTPTCASVGRKAGAFSSFAALVGDAMQRHRRTILAIQWVVVFFYLLLLIVPAFMPLPDNDAHIYDNLRLFAQFMFWGIWWPFVMVGTMLLGRVWCGVFCPEGALTEMVSRHGLGKPIPRWIRWGGWPFVAFVCTTVYGQLVSVYEYPKAALLVLGGSTVAALGVGFVYGKGKRVWCRYLCPANGVFALLAKIAPLHFRVDEEAWKRNKERVPMVDCAPLIDIRHMKSASSCHACGRCSSYRGAVQLSIRNPAEEILNTRNRDVGRGEALTLIFGVIGIATAAFQWSASREFVRIKTMIATWLVDNDFFMLLQDNAPWWMLTHYPEANDVFTWLDGACILGYILGIGLAIGTLVFAAIWMAARAAKSQQLSWKRLALGLVPLAGTGVFLGLSMLTLGHLKAERLPLDWVPPVRIALLAGGSVFSAYLGWRLIALPLSIRRLAAFGIYLLPVALIVDVWASLFFA